MAKSWRFREDDLRGCEWVGLINRTIPIQLLALLSLSSVLFGCGTSPGIYVHRKVPTHIRAGDRTALVILSFAECRGQACQHDCSTEKAGGVNRRLMDAVLAHSNIKILPMNEQKDLIGQAILKGCPEVGQGAQELDRLLPELLGNLQEAGVRFLILAVFSRSDSAYDQFGGAGPVVGIGRHREYKLHGKVVRVDDAQEVGTVSFVLYGTSGWLLIPPLPYSGISEWQACDSFGKWLSEFLGDRR